MFEVSTSTTPLHDKHRSKKLLSTILWAGTENETNQAEHSIKVYENIN